MNAAAKSAKIDAWWFAAGDRLPHGDGRKIVIGKKHSVRGTIVLCSNALHASRDPFDALYHAPGEYLYRVRCWGDVVEDADKLGARNREYVAMRDAAGILRRWAREQALSVIHLWDAPEIVRLYLETGDEAAQDAAQDAAVSFEEDAAMRDAAGILRRWAREQALSVIHLWDAPEIVRLYLETGDEAAQDAAQDAAVSFEEDAAMESAAWAAWAAAMAAASPAMTAAVEAGAAAIAAMMAASPGDDGVERAAQAARKRFGELVADLFAEGAP